MSGLLLDHRIHARCCNSDYIDRDFHFLVFSHPFRGQIELYSVCFVARSVGFRTENTTSGCEKGCKTLDTFGNTPQTVRGCVECVYDEFLSQNKGNSTFMFLFGSVLHLLTFCRKSSSLSQKVSEKVANN